MGAENSGILYLSGQTASEYDPKLDRVVCKGDLLDQTRVIYEKLAVVLEAAGMSFQNVVQTVDYIDATALPLYRETGAIRKEYLGDNNPLGATGICVERCCGPTPSSK
jgi:enamine deaminase RidA (YjgF/YER057c/UK114 family)